MRVPTYSCDSCMGIINSTDGTWIITTEDELPGVPSLTVFPWADGQADKEKTKHACSRTCASRVIAEFLDTAKIDEEKRQAKTYPSFLFPRIWFGDDKE